jgi:hypothetical protein
LVFPWFKEDRRRIVWRYAIIALLIGLGGACVTHVLETATRMSELSRSLDD